MYMFRHDDEGVEVVAAFATIFVYAPQKETHVVLDDE